MTRPHHHGMAEQPRAIVTLANGLPAWTRNRRVTQSMIDRYGSREQALAAMEGMN